ncbi:hypothetical protein HMPREF1544_03054 [Mucor circinelloides 1006PhL]|uniref:Uncharacterized protein n=1 Tax=Mucor circinelloides f. circinelloides (strain 1006PhL) TaxID=1220926 RepID=S2K424_MUCC1|nr:hypothetical protein HMPREF1544_03054 [Mucor circinelloides 1006PhL]
MRIVTTRGGDKPKHWVTIKLRHSIKLKWPTIDKLYSKAQCPFVYRAVKSLSICRNLIVFVVPASVSSVWKRILDTQKFRAGIVSVRCEVDEEANDELNTANSSSEKTIDDFIASQGYQPCSVEPLPENIVVNDLAVVDGDRTSSNIFIKKQPERAIFNQNISSVSTTKKIPATYGHFICRQLTIEESALSTH